MKLEKKFSIFPWFKDVHSQMQRTFTFGNEKTVEDALESLVEPVKSELDNIFKEYDNNRAEALLNVVKDCLLYLHFQNILHRDGFQDSKYLYLKLLSSFLDLCIVLSAHLSSSCMDMAFQHLYLCSKSDVTIMYDVLLQCRLLKKAYAELCCPILGQVLSLSVNRDLEPEQFMKFILLARLCKVFTEKTEKEHIKALVAKTKVPRDFMEFIASFPVPEISSASTHVKSKKIAVYFLCNKFPKNVLMDVKQILCNETLVSIDKDTTSVPAVLPSDVDGNELLFCIDRGSVVENELDDGSAGSYDDIPKSSDVNEYQHLQSSSKPLNSSHEEPFELVEENFDVQDENRFVDDDVQNVNIYPEDDHPGDDDAKMKSKELNDASFSLHFSLSPDRLQCSAEVSKSGNEITFNEDSFEEPLEVSSSEKTINTSIRKNKSKKKKYIDISDSKSPTLPSQNEIDSKSSESSEANEEFTTTKNLKSPRGSKKESEILTTNDDSFLNVSDAVQVNDKSVGDLMNVSSISTNMGSLSSEKLSDEALKRCKTWIQEFEPAAKSEECMDSCESSSSKNDCQNGCDSGPEIIISSPSSTIVEVEKVLPVSTSPAKQGCNEMPIVKKDNQQSINLKPVQEASAFEKCEQFVDTESESKNSSDSCSDEHGPEQPIVEEGYDQQSSNLIPMQEVSAFKKCERFVETESESENSSDSCSDEHGPEQPIVEEGYDQQSSNLIPMQEVSAFKKCERFVETESESENSSDSCSNKQESDPMNTKIDLTSPSGLLDASNGVNLDNKEVAADNKKVEVVEGDGLLAISACEDESQCRYVKCLYPGQNLPSKASREKMPCTKTKRLNSRNESQTEKVVDEYRLQNSCISSISPSVSLRSSKLNGEKVASPSKPDNENDSPSRKRVKLEESLSKITKAKTISALSPVRELRNSISKQTRLLNSPQTKSLRQTPVKATNAGITDTKKYPRKSPTPSKILQYNENQSDSEFHSPDTSDYETSEFGSPSSIFGKKTRTCHTESAYGLRKMCVNLAKNNAAFNLKNTDARAGDKSVSQVRDVETPSEKKTRSSKKDASSQGSIKDYFSRKNIPSSPSGKDKSGGEFSPPTLRSPAKKYNLRIRTKKTPQTKTGH